MLLTVRNKPLFTLDGRIFGQFMERAEFGGEAGPEAALIAGTRELQPEARKLIEEVAPPIIRFPGGCGMEQETHWFDLVDNAFGRTTPGRPIHTGKTGLPFGREFGIDEFLRLCSEIKSEPLLVVSISRPFLPEPPQTLAEAITEAQAFLAYCNAAVDADLPQDLRRWAELRARNGREKPYGVRLWQIGNEPNWMMIKHLQQKGMSALEISRTYVDTVSAFIRALRQVDPGIEVLVEAQMEDPNRTNVPVIDRLAAELGDEIQYLTCHHYAPWAMNILKKDGQDLPPDQLRPEEFWYACMSPPWMDPETGLARYGHPALTRARQLGYGFGVTEWNWNGWWKLDPDLKAKMPKWLIAKGVGSAGYLHAFMREADTIRLATQSMFIGQGWDFAAIHVDRAGQAPPFVNPCGRIIGLYARNHGNAVLPVEMRDVPWIAQPLQLGQIQPSPRMSILDAVATRDGRTLFVHVINRSFGEDVSLGIRLAEFATAQSASVLSVVGELVDGQVPNSSRLELGRASIDGTLVTTVLPRRSVSVVRVSLDA